MEGKETFSIQNEKEFLMFLAVNYIANLCIKGASRKHYYPFSKKNPGKKYVQIIKKKK
jgi:hypothetical protein